MSRSQGTHSPNIPYDPLPLAHDSRNPGYRDPPSPLASSFDSTPVEMTSFLGGVPDSTMPRFLPAARHLEGGNEYRDSFVSHHTFQTAQSAPSSSVYALQHDSGTEFAEYRDDPASGGTPDLQVEPSRYLGEKRSAYSSPRTKSKRAIIIFGSIVAAIIVIIAVAVPVLLVVNKSRKNNATPSTSTPSATPGTGSGKVAAVTGGNGTTSHYLQMGPPSLTSTRSAVHGIGIPMTLLTITPSRIPGHHLLTSHSNLVPIRSSASTSAVGLLQNRSCKFSRYIYSLLHN
ncbi:hypothetical protein EV363DRAFT_723808 [Boletus edulis]|nr:hypothetical protein EV363DRAFT_723808 [Boletus edulis]